MRYLTVAAATAVLAAFVLAGGPASALAAPKLDKASPILMKHCSDGKHIKEALLTA